MSSAVRKLPAQARSTAMPRPARSAKAARATIASSIGGVAPRPLTSSATRSPRTRPRSDTIACRISATSSSAGCSGPRRTPASPWMPRPSSISLSPRVKPGLPAVGTVQAPSATPMVPRSAAAARASAATSASVLPAAIAAPASLWTSTVPAMPRRRAGSTVSRSATSSATTTISTGMPSSCASSAARPKFSRSPV